MLRDASMLGEHQLVAIDRLDAVLQEFGGALLADEPGLGKSFVAAELAARMQRRGCAVELIVPASLVSQWQETLRGFHVSATVLSHDRLLTDPTVHEAGRRLVIVDEAHAFRNPTTQRYSALARRSVGARLLLVTATPVCNSARDLEALLRLIVADDALLHCGVPSIDHAFETSDRDVVARIVATLVVRRGQTVLPHSLRFGELDRAVIRHEPVDVREQIEELTFPLVTDKALLRQFLLRRLQSSEAAFLESVRRQRRFYERALECMASGRNLPKRAYRAAFAHEEDAAAVQSVLFWEVFVPDEAVGSADEIEDELRRLDALRNAVSSARSTKIERLLDVLSPEPTLIFTGWAATAIAIHDKLRCAKYRVALVTGRERTRAADSIAAFRAGHADVLVSTDLGAEGLNLQRAGVVIHYDLPWNPTRLDQRNGRAHRIGQRRDTVRAIYFVPAGDPIGVVDTIVRKKRISKKLLAVGGQAILPVPMPSHLRPRVPRHAAILSFIAAAKGAGWGVPPELDRRHKAGIEGLLATMATEHIDEARLRDLEALLSEEPWAVSRPLRFTNL